MQWRLGDVRREAMRVWMAMALWEKEFACVHRQMLVVASVTGGLWGDEVEGERFLSSFPGEVEGLETTWGDLAPDAAKCGNVEVDLGVVVVGDGGTVDGSEGVAEESLGV